MRKTEPEKRIFLFNIFFISFFIIIFLFLLKIPGRAQGDISFEQSKYKDLIMDYARKYNIPATLIHSVIAAESDYNPKAVSSKGAVGLMQLMPETAEQYGVTNSYDPRENIEGGVKYLKDLIRTYKGRTDLVLAAYNAGKEAIKKHKGIPPYPETINFIRKVKKLYNKPFIRFSSIIYTFYDSSGRLVITNNPRLKAANSKQL